MENRINICAKTKTGSTIIYELPETKQEENLKNEKSSSQLEIKELKLKLHKKVTWTEDTVDNEHMNKKKSKSKNIKFLNNQLFK